MSLEFKQVDRDDTLENLAGLLETIVTRPQNVKTAQYQVESDVSINKFLEDETNHRRFFETFSECANQYWGESWDFSHVPFRAASDRIDALISIVRSGGAYSDGQSLSEAQQVEEEFRFRFKGTASELVILSVATYEYSDDITKSYSINGDDYRALRKISPWFLQVAWDNLIFIINPETRVMYVIAFTDED